VTHVITEPCIGSKDQSCVEVCPVDCIYEAAEMLVIHPGECIDCGACIPECPVQAIHPDDDLPPGGEPYVDINAAITRGAEAVDLALAARAA
jgi:NAD-dependent dihydropyrimidine dehydrogenase PreA subunit